MGQYYKKRKIGTCETMYYMRLAEAQALAAQGARDDDGISFNNYLTDNTTRFRFPFPDEDGLTSDAYYKNHEKSFLLPASDIDVHHDTICVHNTHQGGGYGFNMFLPCPYSQEFKNLGLQVSIGGQGSQYLHVLYEGVRNGEIKTIFACARCGQQQRFSTDDVERIKTQSREYYEGYKPMYDVRNDKKVLIKGDELLYNNALKVIERIK